MAQPAAEFLQAFLDDFERFHRLRSDVLERYGADEFERSADVNQAHANLGKRIALARKYAEAAGVPGTNVDLFFHDEHADRTREALLTAIGAYEHGLVQVGVFPTTRERDQKFRILDAPGVLEHDLRDALGSLGAALIYLDIDHFKQVNTKYTERVVDKTVLPQFQQLVADATLGHGHAYAEGGDEVVVLLPIFSPAMASAFANDLLVLVRSTAFAAENAKERLTISVGLAIARNAEDVALLPDRANLAKKHSKEQGRDRVSLWTPSGCKPCPNMPPWTSEPAEAKRPTPDRPQPNYGTLDELFENRERGKRKR